MKAAIESATKEADVNSKLRSMLQMVQEEADRKAQFEARRKSLASRELERSAPAPSSQPAWKPLRQLEPTPPPAAPRMLLTPSLPPPAPSFAQIPPLPHDPACEQLPQLPQDQAHSPPHQPDWGALPPAHPPVPFSMPASHSPLPHYASPGCYPPLPGPTAGLPHTACPPNGGSVAASQNPLYGSTPLQQRSAPHQLTDSPGSAQLPSTPLSMAAQSQPMGLPHSPESFPRSAPPMLHADLRDARQQNLELTQEMARAEQRSQAQAQESHLEQQHAQAELDRLRRAALQAEQHRDHTAADLAHRLDATVSKLKATEAELAAANDRIRNDATPLQLRKAEQEKAQLELQLAAGAQTASVQVERQANQIAELEHSLARERESKEELRQARGRDAELHNRTHEHLQQLLRSEEHMAQQLHAASSSAEGEHRRNQELLDLRLSSNQRIDQLTQQLEGTKAQLSELQGEHEALRLHNQALSRQSDARVAAVDAKLRLDAAQEVGGWKHQSQVQQEAAAALMAQLKALECKAEAEAAHAAENQSTLERELEESRLRLAEVEERASTLHTQAAHLDAQVKQADAQVAESEAQRREAVQRAHEALEQCGKLQGALAQAQGALGQLDQVKREHALEVERLRSALDGSEHEQHTLREQLRESEVQNKRVQEQAQSAEHRVLEGEARAAEELERVRREAQAQAGQLGGERDRLARLCGEHKETEQRLQQQVQEQTEAAGMAIQMHQRTAGELEGVTRRAVEAEAAQRQSELRLEAIRRDSSCSLDNAHGSVAQLRTEKRELADRLAQHERQGLDVERGRQQLVEQHQAEVSRLYEQLNGLRRDIDQMHAQRAATSSSLDSSSRDRVAALVSEAERARAESDQARSELMACKAQLALVESQLRSRSAADAAVPWTPAAEPWLPPNVLPTSPLPGSRPLDSMLGAHDSTLRGVLDEVRAGFLSPAPSWAQPADAAVANAIEAELLGGAPAPTTEQQLSALAASRPPQITQHTAGQQLSALAASRPPQITQHTPGQHPAGQGSAGSLHRGMAGSLLRALRSQIWPCPALMMLAVHCWRGRAKMVKARLKAVVGSLRLALVRHANDALGYGFRVWKLSKAALAEDRKRDSQMEQRNAQIRAQLESARQAFTEMLAETDAQSGSTMN